MLRYTIKRILHNKGIIKPVAFFMKYGFNANTATRLINGKYKGISLHHIEKLCLIFKCTPNDLIEWVPDSPEQANANLQLSKLIYKETPIDLRNIGQDIPVDKLHEFAQKIREIKKEYNV